MNAVRQIIAKLLHRYDFSAPERAKQRPARERVDLLDNSSKDTIGKAFAQMGLRSGCRGSAESSKRASNGFVVHANMKTSSRALTPGYKQLPPELWDQVGRQLDLKSIGALGGANSEFRARTAGWTQTIWYKRLIQSRDFSRVYEQRFRPNSYSGVYVFPESFDSKKGQCLSATVEAYPLGFAFGNPRELYQVTVPQAQKFVELLCKYGGAATRHTLLFVGGLSEVSAFSSKASELNVELRLWSRWLDFQVNKPNCCVLVHEPFLADPRHGEVLWADGNQWTVEWEGSRFHMDDCTAP